MTYERVFEFARRIGHECFETTEGIYCTKCACNYRDLDEYFSYHRVEHRRNALGVPEPTH